MQLSEAVCFRSALIPIVPQLPVLGHASESLFDPLGVVRRSQKTIQLESGDDDHVERSYLGLSTKGQQRAWPEVVMYCM